MKCKNCEFEYSEQYDYCPNCGTPKAVKQPTEQMMVEVVSLNPTADRVMGVLRDNGFLALCILMSIACVLSLNGGLPLINILITIFLWLTYFDAKKGFVNEKHLQCVSGTVYASYVITNVVSIILIVCGALMGVAFPFALSNAEVLDEINKMMLESGMPLEELNELTKAFSLLTEDQIETIGLIMGIAIAVAFVLMGAIILVINILGFKKIHGFAKSVYMGVMFQNPNFQNLRAAKNWLMFFGICSAIAGATAILSAPVTALAAGCEAAAAIIASVLIDRHLIDKPTIR